MNAAFVGRTDADAAPGIAQSLGGRRTAHGYSAHCPAHDDQHASLSIAEKGGQILFKCHAGCSQESVLQALRERGLWPPSYTDDQRKDSIVRYTYADEAGNPLHRVCRTPQKRFFQEHFDGRTWARGIGHRTVLYHLDELLTRANEPVWVAEGEKDVDRLRAFGHLATCNPMGAGKWKDDYSDTLSGRDVFIFFDNDPPSKNFVGQVHAAKVAHSLTHVGCRVRIIKLPYGKDVSEFLERGGSVSELERLTVSAPVLNVVDISNWKFSFLTPSSQSGSHIIDDVTWPDPLPFVSQRVESIRTECLTGDIGDYCAALARATETPVEFTILTVLGVLSTATAGKVQIEAEPAYVEPSNIYVCGLLESGTRKTAVLDAATRPLIEYEAREWQRLLPETLRTESERKTKIAIIDKLRKRIADGDESGIQRIAALEAALPTVPLRPLLFSTDATPERLEVLLAEHGGRMAIISDEGGPFDVMNGRYSRLPNLDVFLKGHCQAPLRVQRMGRATLVDKPYLTMVVAPQPSVIRGLKAYLRGRGLLARFLYVMPESPVGKRSLVPSHIPGAVTEAYRRTIFRVLDWNAERTLTLRPSVDAYSIWKDFQRSVEADMKEGHKLSGIQDWGSKLPEPRYVSQLSSMCLRTAMLFLFRLNLSPNEKCGPRFLFVGV